MATGRYRGLFGLLLIGTACSFVPVEGRTTAETAGSVTLKSVKYGELVDAVRGSKGKVVVVDVWAEF